MQSTFGRMENTLTRAWHRHWYNTDRMFVCTCTDVWPAVSSARLMSTWSRLCSGVSCPTKHMPTTPAVFQRSALNTPASRAASAYTVQINCQGVKHIQTVHAQLDIYMFWSKYEWCLFLNEVTNQPAPNDALIININGKILIPINYKLSFMMREQQIWDRFQDDSYWWWITAVLSTWGFLQVEHVLIRSKVLLGWMNRFLKASVLRSWWSEIFRCLLS